MGGYIGSVVFGNLMIIVSTTKLSKYVTQAISGVMVFVSPFWFSDLVTTLILFTLAAGLYFLSCIRASRLSLAFLGVACTAYCLQDFQVGPFSDLEQYEKEIGFLSVRAWSYVWLSITVCITVLTLLKTINIKDDE